MSLLPDEKPVPISRENPFRAIARMVKTSAGRLPAHLVIIFFIALSLTILCAIFFQFAEVRNQRSSAYLYERLSPQTDKPPLTENAVAGTWVAAAGDSVATLRLANGTFEIVTRYKNAPISRYFIRGGYRIDGNVLILQERKDLGSPIDPDHLEYRFYPLSIRTINLYGESDGKTMIWRTPASELSHLDNPEPVTATIFGERMQWAKVLATP